MKPNYSEIQDKAEERARLLIYSWAEDGRHASNDLPLEMFPTAQLAKIAEAVAWASEQGIRGYANIAEQAFLNAPEGIRAAFIACCDSEAYPPSPEHCGPLVEKLKGFHTEKTKREIADRIRQAIDQGNDIDGLMADLVALKAGEQSTHKGTLREQAYALRFDPAQEPPPDEMCMVIGDVPIAARGNLTVPQGKSKVGKSAVISAILGATLRGQYRAEGDTLCIEWKGEATGAIIHLDTEQSLADWHGLVCRGITRSGMPEVSPRLVSLPLVMFSRSERLAILRQTLEHERQEQGTIDLVMLDGVADLCVSPNDEGEALELVSKLHALAQEFKCSIVCVLHENPGSDQGKTRGHLGSELNRKAFANLRIDKDAETSISTIYGSDMRKRDIPKEQGFCFGWDDAAGMHTFQGRAAGLKSAQREAEAITKAREEWEPIFELEASIGKNSAFPVLNPKDASERERELKGNAKLTNTEAMKKRMQKAESLGVLRKTSRTEWALIPSGKSGTNREREDYSFS